jgi:hypothetical protein
VQIFMPDYLTFYIWCVKNIYWLKLTVQ